MIGEAVEQRKAALWQFGKERRPPMGL
jgi:hypothetical protein